MTQYQELFAAAISEPIFGHGGGFRLDDLIRHEVYPWRYEVFWGMLALQHGFFIMALCALALLYTCRFLWIGSSIDSRRSLEIPMLAGLIGSIIASATNPYAASFAFQWMYVLPMSYVFYAKVCSGNQSSADS